MSRPMPQLQMQRRRKATPVFWTALKRFWPSLVEMVKEHVEHLKDLSELPLASVQLPDSSRQDHGRDGAKCVVLTNTQEIGAPRDACRLNNVLVSIAANLGAWRASVQRRRTLAQVDDGSTLSSSRVAILDSTVSSLWWIT